MTIFGISYRHILVEAEYLVSHSNGLTAASLAANPTLQRAFVRSLEIIGEAAKQVPADVRALHPEIEWSSMARMRDRLIHAYFGVDYDLVWDVVATKIPELRHQIVRALGDTR